MKLLVYFGVSVLLLVPGSQVALAGPAAGSAELGGTASASTEEATAAGGASADADPKKRGGAKKKNKKKGKKAQADSRDDAAPEGSERGKKDEKWIHRWAPENHMGEVGVYLGLAFPSRRLELFQADDALPDQGFKQYKRVAADFGIRGGYYPLRFLGVELEGGLIPTKTTDDASALIWTVRGHVVGQLGLWSVTPFVLFGAGALGVASDRNAVGSEVDPTLHFGGGVKFYINRWTQLRLDIRDIISAKQGVDEGSTNTVEILLGFSVTLGRKNAPPPKDTDGDGFPDWRDRCDEVPGVEPHGCPPDRDGDGFNDNVDKCPDTPGVAPDGCPPPDRDGDAIIDVEDKCPDEPETNNGYDDDDGCPDKVPERMKDFAGVIKGIFFDLDRSTIKKESRPVLDNAVDVLKAHPGVEVEIVGHTDATGSRDYNMKLSQTRADAVKKYLVDHGIEADRVSTRGAGPDEPIDGNDTPEGRAKNRRIEFKITSKKTTTRSSAPSESSAPPQSLAPPQ